MEPTTMKTTDVLSTMRWIAASTLVLLLVPSVTLGQQLPSAKSATVRPPAAKTSSLDSLRRRIIRLRPTLPYQRSHATVKTAFRDVVADSRRSTVEVFSNDKRVATGAIVDANGYVLTKFSELTGTIRCRTHDRQYHDAAIVGVMKEFDLAMLRIEAEQLQPITWSPDDQLPVGSWVATTGLSALPQAIGVVSAAARQIPAARGILGVLIDDDPHGAIVQHVMPKSGAYDADVRKDDVITQVNSHKVTNRHDLVKTIQTYRPGDKVQIHLVRGKESKRVVAILGSQFQTGNSQRIEFQKSLGGPLSRRRDGFPQALQHDSVLEPSDCGGPLVGLDGHAIGINIARASRVSSYALPASVVRPLLADLKSGRLAPNAAFVATEPQTVSE